MGTPLGPRSSSRKRSRDEGLGNLGSFIMIFDEKISKEP